MFKVIECINLSPIRLLFNNEIKTRPGIIIDLKENGVDYIISEGNRPFGFIGRRSKIKNLHMVDIWTNRMIFRTNQYEACEYKVGDALYASKNGKLTNIKHKEGILYIARLISPPTKENKLIIEALYL